MGDEEVPDGMMAMPMDLGWLQNYPDEQQKQVYDLLQEFNTAMFYVSTSVTADEDTAMHQQGHVLLGFTHHMTLASLRICQMETAQAGHLGLDNDLLVAIQRSLFGALLLAGIRYGQHHPDAFLADGPHDLSEEIQRLIDGLAKGEPEEGKDN